MIFRYMFRLKFKPSSCREAVFKYIWRLLKYIDAFMQPKANYFINVIKKCEKISYMLF